MTYENRTPGWVATTASHAQCNIVDVVCFGDQHPWIGSAVGAAITAATTIFVIYWTSHSALRRRRRSICNKLAREALDLAHVVGVLNSRAPGTESAFSKEEVGRLRDELQQSHSILIGADCSDWPDIEQIRTSLIWKIRHTDDCLREPDRFLTTTTSSTYYILAMEEFEFLANTSRTPMMRLASRYKRLETLMRRWRTKAPHK